MAAPSCGARASCQFCWVDWPLWPEAVPYSRVTAFLFAVPFPLQDREGVQLFPVNQNHEDLEPAGSVGCLFHGLAMARQFLFRYQDLCSVLSFAQMSGLPSWALKLRSCTRYCVRCQDVLRLPYEAIRRLIRDTLRRGADCTQRWHFIIGQGEEACHIKPDSFVTIDHVAHRSELMSQDQTFAPAYEVLARSVLTELSKFVPLSECLLTVDAHRQALPKGGSRCICPS